jgi:hypothetical protein
MRPAIERAALFLDLDSPLVFPSTGPHSVPQGVVNGLLTSKNTNKRTTFTLSIAYNLLF